jgi:protein-tyrosine phosphatase
MAENKQVSILFVCMGNICRSPTGEGVFHHYIQQQGYGNDIHVDSAGTISYHVGDAADVRMRQAASKRGYALNSIARQVKSTDFQDFNLIIAMDHDNLADLERMAGGVKSHIRLLGSYLKGANSNQNASSVPDPYYGGDQGFEDVLDMIEASCPAILTHCKSLIG